MCAATLCQFLFCILNRHIHDCPVSLAVRNLYLDRSTCAIRKISCYCCRIVRSSYKDLGRRLPAGVIISRKETVQSIELIDAVFHKTISILELAIAHLKDDIASHVAVCFPGDIIARAWAIEIHHIRATRKRPQCFYGLAQARGFLETQPLRSAIHVMF